MASLREQRKLARAVDRARLSEIRSKLRELRRARPVRLRRIREACRVGRENVRSRVRALREETRAQLRASVLAMRTAERGKCARTKQKARTHYDSQIRIASDELLSTAGGRSARARARRARERREESDDEVRRNLPPELVPVFNRMRTEIKRSPRMSRTEAFLHWVHDNPEAAHAIVYDAVDRDVARLVAEQEELERRTYDRAGIEAALVGVPF